MILTREWLLEHGSSACSSLDLFDELWPDGVEVTEANMRRAIAEGIPLDWFAIRLLPRNELRAYRATVIATQQSEHGDGRDWHSFEAKREAALIAAILAHVGS